jgi:hypothetical protein
MDFSKIADMAKQAGDLANNPMAQGVLNNPAMAGIVDQVESMTKMDLNGNGSVGAAVAQDFPVEEVPESVEEIAIEETAADAELPEESTEA